MDRNYGIWTRPVPSTVRSNTEPYLQIYYPYATESQLPFSLTQIKTDLFTVCSNYQRGVKFILRNLGATSKFYAPEGWNEATSIRRPTNIRRHQIKFSKHGNVGTIFEYSLTTVSLIHVNNCLVNYLMTVQELWYQLTFEEGHTDNEHQTCN
jgi:hypothetical protein